MIYIRYTDINYRFYVPISRAGQIVPGETYQIGLYGTVNLQPFLLEVTAVEVSHDRALLELVTPETPLPTGEYAYVLIGLNDEIERGVAMVGFTDAAPEQNYGESIQYKEYE